MCFLIIIKPRKEIHTSMECFTLKKKTKQYQFLMSVIISHENEKCASQLHAIYKSPSCLQKSEQRRLE